MSRYIPVGIRRKIVVRAYGEALGPPPCELRLREVCTGEGDEYHHRRMFSRGGPHTSANLMLLCEPCHRWVHANRRESIRLGLLSLRTPRDPWVQPRKPSQ